MTTENPWGLTQRQAEVLDAVIKTGSQKGAARVLGVSAKTVEGFCDRAAESMECRGDRLRRYILWDRYRQSQAASAALPHALETA